MYKVIVNRTGRYEVLDVEDFIKEYGITPKYQGESFYVISQQGRDCNIYGFPNPACIFMDGSIQYIIYKGNQITIVNGVRMPNADFVPEDMVFGTYDEALAEMHRIEDSHRGEMYIDTPNGRVRVN